MQNSLGTTFKSDALFQEIRQRVAEKAQLAKLLNASYRFKITHGNGKTKNWTIDLKKEMPFVGENCDYKVDTEISLTDDDFVRLAAGELKMEQAFMQGKIKIEGSLGKARMLEAIFDASKIKSRL